METELSEKRSKQLGSISYEGIGMELKSATYLRIRNLSWCRQKGRPLHYSKSCRSQYSAVVDQNLRNAPKTGLDSRWLESPDWEEEDGMRAWRSRAVFCLPVDGVVLLFAPKPPKPGPCCWLLFCCPKKDIMLSLVADCVVCALDKENAPFSTSRPVMSDEIHRLDVNERKEK